MHFSNWGPKVSETLSKNAMKIKTASCVWRPCTRIISPKVYCNASTMRKIYHNINQDEPASKSCQLFLKGQKTAELGNNNRQNRVFKFVFWLTPILCWAFGFCDENYITFRSNQHIIEITLVDSFPNLFLIWPKSISKSLEYIHIG